MERNLALEVVRATEAAALAVARFIGRGDERAADRAACDAMRKALNSIAFDGKVVIGEGEQGSTDQLYIGEIVGTGAGPEVDVALDALEGPHIAASGGPNALSCIALAERGKVLNCPDTYMDKIACGPLGRGVIDIDRSPTDNLKALAEAKNQKVLILPIEATSVIGAIAGVAEIAREAFGDRGGNSASPPAPSKQPPTTTPRVRPGGVPSV